MPAICASPIGNKVTDNDDKNIYTTRAKKNQRLQSGRNVQGSVSSSKSFKSLQLANPKVCPLNLNLTLKKQISNPKNDQLLQNIARKLKQKRDCEQLQSYNSTGALEHAFAAREYREQPRE